MNQSGFTCPHCSQPIPVSPGQGGSLITCPSCNQQVQLPGAPPQPGGQLPPLPPPVDYAASTAIPPMAAVRPKPSSGSKVIMITAACGVLLVLLAIAVAAVVYVKKSKSPSSRHHGIRAVPTPEFPDRPPIPNRSMPGSRSERLPVPEPRQRSQAPEEQVSTDPTSVEIPTSPVAGVLGGEKFQLEDCRMPGGGTLHLSTGKGLQPEIIIFTFIPQPEIPGTEIIIPRPESDRRRATPHVHLKWREDNRIKTEILTQGYSLKLVFDELDGTSLPGRIYFEAPSRFETKISGTFTATVSQDSRQK